MQNGSLIVVSRRRSLLKNAGSPFGPRSCHNLLLPQLRTTCNGLETISFHWCILWQALSNDRQQSGTLSSLIGESKSGKEENAIVDYVDLSWFRLGS